MDALSCVADRQNLPMSYQHDVERLLSRAPADSAGAVPASEPPDSDPISLSTKPHRRGVYRAVSHSALCDVTRAEFSDILSSQATNKPELTAALFSDAQRMAYTLRLNAVTPPEGASAVDVELGRRIFWHLYSTDKWVTARHIETPQG
jgi:hypothetical protein